MTNENPEQINLDAIAKQNEHDHATGNINESGQTPSEAMASEVE